MSLRRHNATDPGPFDPCVWPLVDGQPCNLTYGTVVAGLPLCTMHAQEAISIVLTGKTFAEIKAGTP